MFQYCPEPLLKLRPLVAASFSFDDSGGSDGGSLYSNPQDLTTQVTTYRQMDEARESVIEDTPNFQSLLIYLRIIILQSQLQATREKASEAVSGNRASRVRRLERVLVVRSRMWPCLIIEEELQGLATVSKGCM